VSSSIRIGASGIADLREHCLGFLRLALCVVGTFAHLLELASRLGDRLALLATARHGLELGGGLDLLLLLESLQLALAHTVRLLARLLASHHGLEAQRRNFLRLALPNQRELLRTHPLRLHLLELLLLLLLLLLHLPLRP
jgi:hypothetical protein